jgi:hypothetical protein
LFTTTRYSSTYFVAISHSNPSDEYQFARKTLPAPKPLATCWSSNRDLADRERKVLECVTVCGTPAKAKNVSGGGHPSEIPLEPSLSVERPDFSDMLRHTIHYC